MLGWKLFAIWRCEKMESVGAGFLFVSENYECVLGMPLFCTSQNRFGDVSVIQRTKDSRNYN